MQGVSIEDYETSLSATELLNILEAEVWKIRWTNVFIFFMVKYLQTNFSKTKKN